MSAVTPGHRSFGLLELPYDMTDEKNVDPLFGEPGVKYEELTDNNTRSNDEEMSAVIGAMNEPLFNIDNVTSLL
jgi:hypothetical protein